MNFFKHFKLRFKIILCYLHKNIHVYEHNVSGDPVINVWTTICNSAFASVASSWHDCETDVVIQHGEERWHRDRKLHLRKTSYL